MKKFLNGVNSFLKHAKTIMKLVVLVEVVLDTAKYFVSELETRVETVKSTVEDEE